MIDASIGQRLLPGLFPPPPRDLDASLRRVLLSLLSTLTVGGSVAYLVFSRDAVLVAPLAVAAAGVVLALAVPWHRFSRDAFATVGVVTVAWVTWLVWLTGGADSPYTPFTMPALAVSAIPLSRRLGVVLGVAAAATAGLPLLYTPTAPTSAETAELLTGVTVLAIAGVFGPWLMEEVRRAIRVARMDGERLETTPDRSFELERAHQGRQEYLSVLAHELRNPLNAIGAAARVLAKDIAELPGEATAKAIVAEAHHALELLDGLTDVASIESGRMRLALRPMDLAAVLTETAGATVNGHGIALRGAEFPTVVLGDDRRLSQVVRNLIGNAAKYSPPDSEIQVSLGISADRRNAIVQVRDQGPGIPPAERARLFEKFARLSTAGATRGSGLGLYISRGIVHDHGGELWADWPAGGGSVFSFSVPLTREDRGTEAPRP